VVALLRNITFVRHISASGEQCSQQGVGIMAAWSGGCKVQRPPACEGLAGIWGVDISSASEQCCGCFNVEQAGSEGDGRHPRCAVEAAGRGGFELGRRTIAENARC